ncbi:MAG: hypothetical protein DWQ10_03520 [Calditrichaeota bacterium]|nr:MAG: hypothetical protein DWQ10_03520 [Calditrichota bacterium]
MGHQHKSLAAGRWAEMPFVEQMANIGSEISRALNWKNKKKEEYCLKAVVRALELLSFTIESVEINSHNKELTRLREAIIDYFYGSNEYGSTDALWEKYFYHFNVAARKDRNE